MTDDEKKSAIARGEFLTINDMAEKCRALRTTTKYHIMQNGVKASFKLRSIYYYKKEVFDVIEKKLLASKVIQDNRSEKQEIIKANALEPVFELKNNESKLFYARQQQQQTAQFISAVSKAYG